jgi:dihydroxyacid dehydratase/phosphogluconate dehydratase
MAVRSARALLRMESFGLRTRDVLTDDAIHNAMVVHAAFGGSTNLVLHVPAIARAAGLRRPMVEVWTAVKRAVPGLSPNLGISRSSGPKGSVRKPPRWWRGG